MEISIYHILGIVLAVVLIEVFGIISVRRVKNARDFTTGGGRAGTWTVCGIIMGTLIGGQSTIGTAQLAFSFGISAWWFTLGAAFGCVVLALGYIKSLRRSQTSTLLEVVSKEYGKKVEVTGSILCSIGIFVSIVAQVISASALLMTLFPISLLGAAICSGLIMVLFVVFGGVWSAGIGGVVKLILLCISTLASGIVVLSLAHGYDGLLGDIHSLFTREGLDTICDFDINARYSNIFARGTASDIGSCLSVILGVLSTQSYAQGIYAAKSDSAARRGALISALLTIPIGVACVFVGLYMRGHYVTTSEAEMLANAGVALPDGVRVLTSSVQVFPVFITHHLPKFIGGIVLGTLLITVIIGGAGLSLGASAILVRDVFMKFSNKLRDPLHNLLASRLTIVILLTIAVVVGISFSGSFINDLGFLSMGLRATAVFVPLTMALLCRGHFKGQVMLFAIIAGTATLLVVKLSSANIDPTFIGLAVTLFIALCGYKPSTKLIK